MPRRRAAAAALSHGDISIHGDELEQHRIQLEHNLQHTDLSLHLTDTPGSDDVEFPRHNSGPDTFAPMPPFDPHPDDHFADEHSPFHAWSYRSAEDDDAAHTYAAESTAAHHASALTLSAGLGGRGGRRDASVSGAEYDPDRPLHGIMAGITSRISAFNLDDTKSRTAAVDFDPLVADDSADLVDVAARQARYRPPAPGLRSSSTSSSSSRPETPMSPRPTLADALQSVAFSPKRPRGALPQPQVQPSSKNAARFKATVVDADDVPTPVSRSRSRSKPLYGVFPQQSLSYATAPEPEVNVHPPTPPLDPPSQFSKTAKNVKKEIAFDMDTQKTSRRRASAKTTEREGKPAAMHPRVAGLRTPFRGGERVHLPDVTGLTSAIASPARLGLEYLGYDAQEDAEVGARLVATLGLVQAKLAHLEAENSVSRRRVRELEMELEDCKKEVAKERTRVIEREQVIGQQKRRAAEGRAEREQRDREKAADADRSRYKEVVEEQKALQALVMTLKGHLTRLTTELSEHHRLLEELRGLRDTDVHTLRDKSREVDGLRREVERLGGEVEVLRGVVEEGLKERRELRDRTATDASSHAILRPADDSLLVESQPHQVRLPDDSEDEEETDEEDASLSERAVSPSPSPRHRFRTPATDRATVGGSPPDADLGAGEEDGHPFIDEGEIERISEEISERRGERSTSRSHSQLSHEDESEGEGEEEEGGGPVRTSSPAPSSQRATVRAASTVPSTRSRASARAHPHPHLQSQPQLQSHPHSQPQLQQPQAQPTRTHPTQPTRAHPTQPTRTHPTHPLPPPAGDVPIPHMRGAYLERLFFSAPQHHAGTCTVCHRRRRDEGRPDDRRDERDLKERLRDAETEGRTKGKARAEEEQEDEDEEGRVPPQTVLARVLRELEDDFAHYKEIYIELADQYKVVDPVVHVAKRNVLAAHLREVIGVLEQKGDQIASLYDLLTYGDKPRGAAARGAGVGVE